MPYNSSGQYTRVHNWTDDRDAGIKIRADRTDQENNDIAAAFNQVILRSGVAPMSGNLNMGQQRVIGIGNGTQSVPAIQYSNDPVTGPYLNGSGRYAIAANATRRFEVNTTGAEVVGDLAVSGSVTGTFSGNVTGNVIGNVTGNVTGDVSGTAANVTGVVAIANGGTGATTAANARTNLGLGALAVQNSIDINGQSNGTLEVSRGGTGVTTATGTGSVVRNSSPQFAGQVGFGTAPVSEFTTTVQGVNFGNFVTTDRFGILGNNMYFSAGQFRAASQGWAAGWTLAGSNGETIRLLASTGAASARGDAISVTERIVILNNGNVGLGTSSPAFALDVNGAARANVLIANSALGYRNAANTFQYTEAFNEHVAHYKVTSNTFAYYWRTSDNGALDGPNQRTIAEWKNDSLEFRTNNAVAVTVDGSQNMTVAGNITAFSDERLKENIFTIGGALDKVRRMRGVTYTKKDTGHFGTGVIAQEMMCVMPEVVNTNGEYLAVAYGNLVGVLIEAIKELADKIEGQQ